MGNRRFNVSVRTNVVGSKISTDVDFEDNEIDGLTENELGQMLLNMIFDMGMVEFEYEEITDE